MRKIVGMTAVTVLAGVLLLTAADARSSKSQGKNYTYSTSQSTRIHGNVGGPVNSQLTQEQRNRIMEIRQANRQQMTDINADRSLSATQRQQRIRQVQTETHSKIMDVLTPEQRTAYGNWWQDRSTPGTMGQGPSSKRGVGTGTWSAGLSGNIPQLRQHPLTADQRQRIADMMRDEQRDIQSANNNRKLSSQQRADKIREIKSRTRSDIWTVLTVEQRNELQSGSKYKK